VPDPQARLAPHYWNDKGKGSGLLTEDGCCERRSGHAQPARLDQNRGRMKDVIKSGGYSVYARELEEAILAHPAVARAIASPAA